MSKKAQVSFGSGEISPALYARRDLDKHESALASTKNCFISPEGGISNRQGLHYAETIKNILSEGARLIPFAFNVEQQYALEFGDYYMRVIRNGSYVYEAAKTIVGITKASPGVVEITSHGYTDGDQLYFSDVAGMPELNNRSALVANGATNTFELTDFDGVAIDTSGYSAAATNGSSAKAYEIVSPYSVAVLQQDPNDPTKPGLKYTQSQDTMTITLKGFPTYNITRTDHDAWTLLPEVYSPTQAGPTAIDITPAATGAATTAYKVTAVDAEGEEESLPGRSNTTFTITGATNASPCVITVGTTPTSDVGDEVEIDSVVGMTQLNDRRFIVDAVSGNDISLRDEDSTDHTAYASAGTLYATYDEITNSHVTANNSIAFTAAANASKYNIYRREDGLFGFIGSTQGPPFVDNNSETIEDESDTPPIFRDPFQADGDRPQTTTFFEARKAYAGSALGPQEFHLSRTNAFNNFAYSSPRRATDAIQRTINSRQINEIRHLVPLNNLLLLTSGAEWRVFAGSEDSITPNSIIVKPQTHHGSSHVRPLIIGGSVLFVQRQGNIVRDLQYRLQNDSYQGDNRSLLARHLFENRRVVEWDYSEVPDSLVWVVMTDGKLLSMTYVPEQELYAWTSHETRGDVESLCIVEESNDPIIYMIVKRTVGGKTRRFIEYLRPRLFDEESDAKFLDSMLTLDNPVTITGFTSASPCVVEATAHGFLDGEVIDISKVRVLQDASASDANESDKLLNPYRYAPINRDGWVAANVTANTFEITDSDGGAVDGSSWRLYADSGEARKAVTEVSGLHHLAGSTITALANGNVITGLVVSATGQITLQAPASRIHAGVPYYAEFEALDIEFDDDDGTSTGRKRKVSRVFLNVDRTRGIAAGPTRGKLTNAKEARDKMTTGAISISIRPKHDRGGRYVVRQANPLPMTVLSATPDFNAEEDG